MTIQNQTTINVSCTPSTGWVVKAVPGYYTGNDQSQIERWTTFPKLAKIYKRKGWAQKIAERLAGQVIPAEPAKMTTHSSHNGRPRPNIHNGSRSAAPQQPD